MTAVEAKQARQGTASCWYVLSSTNFAFLFLFFFLPLESSVHDVGLCIILTVQYIVCSPPIYLHTTPILQACCFALTPLHFFFSFLWYTDVASTLSFLALWWIVEDAARRRNVVETQRSGSLRPFYHFVGSGLLAVGSIAMRQTNAVWVAFVAARVLLLTCLPPRAPASAAVVTSNVPRTTRQRKGQKRYVVQEIVENACLHRRRLIMLTCPLMPPLLAFAAFVKYNGGVAIGDKQNHQPVLHWAQPFYCALYCSLALFPVLWTPSEVKKTAMDVAKATRRRPWAAVVCIAVLIGAIRYGTLVHPFLLADNRHYTFYIWRRILDRTPWMRFAFVPAYVHSCAAIYRHLYAAGRHPLEIGLLAASAVTVLVPTRLIELRYFTPSLCAVFVLAKTPNLRQLMVLMVAYAILDAATLYAFVFLPFTWPDGSVARFMW
jgi:alpha-1,2-glucosyltransferase